VELLEAQGLPAVTGRTDLARFLQARRGRVRPEAVGIETYGRRRVKGLRREELSALAGVSVDYYVRLEQGRASNPSEEVLDAIARALLLDDSEVLHLHRLARPGAGRRAPLQRTEVVRPGIARLLASMDGVPAYLLGRRLDLLAWTRVGSALLGDFASYPRARRNLARLVFLEPSMQELLPDWRDAACETVGLLQLAAGRNPGDPGIAALVDELSTEREAFRSLWANHDVAEVMAGTRRFHHPVVGDLTLDFETLSLPADCSQTLVTYTAQPGSSADTSLKLLASWSASEVRAASGR
jgi:transcriptional regulator with XRE-family HTH domain